MTDEQKLAALHQFLGLIQGPAPVAAPVGTLSVPQWLLLSPFLSPSLVSVLALVPTPQATCMRAWLAARLPARLSTSPSASLSVRLSAHLPASPFTLPRLPPSRVHIAPSSWIPVTKVEIDDASPVPRRQATKAITATLEKNPAPVSPASALFIFTYVGHGAVHYYNGQSELWFTPQTKRIRWEEIRAKVMESVDLFRNCGLLFVQAWMVLFIWAHSDTYSYNNAIFNSGQTN